MTNPQHEALVEAYTIHPDWTSILSVTSGNGDPYLIIRPDGTIDVKDQPEEAAHQFVEYLKVMWGQHCAALSATAATPSDEVVRLRAALEEIAAGRTYVDGQVRPLMAKYSQNLARAALEHQGKDV